MIDIEELMPLVESRKAEGYPVPAEISDALRAFSRKYPQFELVEWQFYDGVLVWEDQKIFGPKSFPPHTEIHQEMKLLESYLMDLPETTHLFFWYGYLS